MYGPVGLGILLLSELKIFWRINVLNFFHIVKLYNTNHAWCIKSWEWINIIIIIIKMPILPTSHYLCHRKSIRPMKYRTSENDENITSTFSTVVTIEFLPSVEECQYCQLRFSCAIRDSYSLTSVGAHEEEKLQILSVISRRYFSYFTEGDVINIQLSVVFFNDISSA